MFSHEEGGMDMCWFMCDWFVIKRTCDDISGVGNVKRLVYMAQFELMRIENLIIHSLKLPF
jgi:hypothetical protein